MVDAEGVKDQLLSYGPFANMVVSPSGNFPFLPSPFLFFLYFSYCFLSLSGQTLACITRNGEVHVCLTDFSKDLYQFATQTTHVPMMAWYVLLLFFFRLLLLFIL